MNCFARKGVVIEGNGWEKQLSDVAQSVVFVDEGNRFVSSVEFARFIQGTDNYYVLVTREGLSALPYSVEEIYGIRSSGKYGGLKPLYHEIYQLYTDKLYSAGGTKEALLAEWDEIEPAFRKALSALRVSAGTPSEVSGMSMKEKEIFAKMFQNFDRLFAQMKSFTNYDDRMLEEYGITQEEYETYAGHYFNVLEEIRESKPDKEADGAESVQIDSDYELMAYSSTKIDYEYIINLIQNIVTPEEDEGDISPEERQKKIGEIRQYVEELRRDNPKIADIMSGLIDEIETDAANHYRNGEIPNESRIKATIDFTSYKAAEKSLPKFKYFAQMMAELKKTLDEEIKPLTSH